MFPTITGAPAAFKARITITADSAPCWAGPGAAPPSAREVPVRSWDAACTCGWTADGTEDASGRLDYPEDCPRCGAECDVDDHAPAYDPDDFDGWETGRF